MMDKDFTRAWRRERRQIKWENRLKHNELHHWRYTFEGETWVDMKKHKYFHLFKTMCKPCSCWSCGGPYYKRRFYKFETDRIIRDELYGDISHQTPRGSKKIVNWD